MIEDEEPQSSLYKSVEFLDSQPKFADTPDGDKTVSLVFSHVEDIEQSLISIEDAEKLIFSVLQSLAYHDNERAQGILKAFFQEELNSEE